MSNPLYIKGGTLIDGNGGAPIPNPGVLIVSGKIAGVGQCIEAQLAQLRQQNLVELDATGKHVMPGLIDGHCHISSSQGAIPGIRYTDSQEFATLWTARAVGQVLEAGFTSLSAPGGKWFVDVTVRDAVNAGMLEGPRIYCAGMPIGPIGNIFDNTHPVTGEITAEGVSAICHSLDDFRKEIRLQAKRGVNMIKIADSYWGDKETIRSDELAQIVDEAHRLGCTVSIHARGSGSTRASALAGMDWIFHADLATDEDLDAVAKAGVPIMPCFTQCHIIATTDNIPGVGAVTRKRVTAQLETAYSVIRKARERGIKLLMGTDSGNTACYEQGRYHGIEGELMVKNIGMTPMEAIVAYTKDNAKVMGLAGQLGTIEADMLADIVIWNADPVKDISVLYKKELLDTVIKDGRVIKRDGIGFRPLPKEPPKANVINQG
ncbi:amidohydrolase family protein [Comamonas testosteroni]|uniref:amidohydrolase family protein n=1 Tax=Comamonas testosteroni TaxID=285 RepID=UPI00389A7A30